MGGRPEDGVNDASRLAATSDDAASSEVAPTGAPATDSGAIASDAAQSGVGSTTPTELGQPVTGWVYPSPSGSRRSWPLALGVAAIAVVAVVAVLIFIGSTIDPRDAAIRDFGQRLLAAPEFRARYGDVDTTDEAFQAGLELGSAAYAHLDDASLLRFWQLEKRMWDNADEPVCAAVFHQTASATQALALMRELDEEDLRALLDLTERAILAELQDGPSPPAPSEAQIDAAYGALATTMGQQTMIDTATVITDASAEDAAVCTAAKSFIGSILELRDPDRAVLLRFMASGN